MGSVFSRTASRHGYVWTSARPAIRPFGCTLTAAAWRGSLSILESGLRATATRSSWSAFAQAASRTILAEYEQAPGSVEALGALNRWPGRGGVPIDDYLDQWEASWSDLKASPLLPSRLR